MIKYLNTLVAFREIPDEISLAINLTNCPFKCVDCHSPQLRDDIGSVLDFDSLQTLIDNSSGITCVLFLGGDSASFELSTLVKNIRDLDKYVNLKFGWYSGADIKYDVDIIKNFDYYKVGSYKKECGSLDMITTNQRLYKVHHLANIEWNDDLTKNNTPFIITYDNNIALEDITYKFWNKQYK